MCGGCIGAKERERTVVELHLEERVLVAPDLELHRAVNVVLSLDLLLALQDLDEVLVPVLQLVAARPEDLRVPPHLGLGLALDLLRDRRDVLAQRERC